MHILFFALATFLILTCISITVVRSPIIAILLFVIAVMTTAGIALLLLANFITLALMMIYAGAVVVLILFTVMMVDYPLSMRTSNPPIAWQKGATIYCIMIALLSVCFKYMPLFISNTPRLQEFVDIEDIGMYLYNDYSYTVIILGVLLLLTTVGAIHIASHIITKVQHTTNMDKQMTRPNNITLTQVPFNVGVKY